VNVENVGSIMMISLMVKPDGLSEIATGKYRMIFGFNGKIKETDSI
tara:strand:- start:435 stop:572 length:138 start_codon:yes stop_codon:yes gene_type:complete